MDQDNRQDDVPGVSAVRSDQIRMVTARAVVAELTETDKDQDAIVAAMKSAAALPMVTDGEPTKLLVTAFLCHVGKNNNNLVFREEDLPAAAAKLTTPNVLPMDWNHSAVIPKEGVPKAIGAWYSADVVWDEDAYGGEGAKGIQAKGVVWAWAFPEYAQEMLEQQRERGYIEFSMACIPTEVERGRDMNGPFEVAIQPVFFTLSALNVPPGDPDAKGTVDNLKQLTEDDADDLWEDLMGDDDDREDEAKGVHETEAAFAMLSAASDRTHFPKVGENKEISLRNSSWKVFPLAEAEELMNKYPEIWKLGEDPKKPDQYLRLAVVEMHGGKAVKPTEEYAVRQREAWVASHVAASGLAGVVKQVRWLAVGSRGLSHMRAVLEEAKKRVSTKQAARTGLEELMEQNEVQTALEQALETNAALKAEVETLTAAKDDLAKKMFDVEESLVKMAARAEEAELKRDALATELATAVEKLAETAGALASANEKLATFAAEQEKKETEERWAARMADLPESYRAALAKRSDEEQARFVARWSAASDEAWTEFKSDLMVGMADTKISYLKLSEAEGALPNGGVTDLGAKVAALIK